jgi:hypothetical protein
MKNPRPLLWIAGAFWLVSWFLPVTEDLLGWQAFRAVFVPPGGDGRGWEDQAAQWLSGLSNFVFAAVFGTLAAGKTIRPGLFIRIATACFIVNLYWFVQLAKSGELKALLIGYYAWMAGYALMVAIALSVRRTSKTPTADTPA